MAMKWCINCDALFVPNKKESNAQWVKRQFCSRRCAQRWRALRRTTIPGGTCAACGGQTPRLIKQLCKPCWSRRRYQEQRERILALNRAWREANPDYWRQPHLLERVRQWNRDHPEATRKSVNAAKRRRRARAAGREVIDIRATEAYVDILRADVCAYCGGPAETIDHIDALVAGGDDTWENLTPACRACNSAKYRASLLHFLLRHYPPQTGQGVEPCCA